MSAITDRRSAADLDFPPVRNGVDYLVSVVDHLVAFEYDHEVTLRDLKYGVLHLQSAVEVLLKARLQREHWALVFKDPGIASEKRFLEGDFESCTTDDSVYRLRRIVGLCITDQEHSALRALAKLRNALQHYGLRHNARAVEARAGEVLDFLVRFLEEELLPGLSPEEGEAVGAEMDRVREGLRDIAAYVTKRMNRLRGELTGWEDRVIHCPDCDLWALVLGPPISRCHFCGTTYPDPGELASAYYWCDPRQDHLVGPCPACHEPTFAREVRLRSAPRDLYGVCLTCTARLLRQTDYF
ncbi:hypothetical protein ABZ370_26570 [Streptomyces sp. NPDC005962]|uniref:hypothetical protein n=1 Tax=Streptomyces sp. NPDC005962 TaxID=3154466 RepID=UPI0034105A47